LDCDSGESEQAAWVNLAWIATAVIAHASCMGEPGLDCDSGPHCEKPC